MTDQTVPVGHSTLPVVCSREALMPFCRKRRRDSWGQILVDKDGSVKCLLSTHQGACSKGLEYPDLGQLGRLLSSQLGPYLSQLLDQQGWESCSRIWTPLPPV